MEILNLFNKILEVQGVDTVAGEILEYTAGNKYIIEDMYNNFYKFHDGENKYYIEFEDGTQIEYNTLDTFIFSVKWLNN